jgi:hypothetical protein
MCSLLLLVGCVEPAKLTEPPPCTNCPAATEDELIQNLAKAYTERSRTRFTDLFPSDADAAPYVFYLNAPINGMDHWDVAEELRLHRRMFEPDAPLVGEVPVPDELWLVSISINLTRVGSSWLERTDLYKSPTNPEGLDASKWRVNEAEFHAEILFETQGETDYRIDARHNFITIEDVTKAAGTARKFLIYRWEDLDPPPTVKTQGVDPKSWSDVKMLYQ